MNELAALWDHIKRQRQGYLRLFLVLVVNVGLYLGLTHRLANKQVRLSSEQSSLAQEVESREQELRQLSTAREREDRNDDTVNQFWDQVVRARVPGLTEAWEEIDELARETGVRRGRTSYDRDILEVGLEQINANMPVEGTYFDLARFINRLERSDRFFLVEEIRLAQRDQPQGEIELTCSIAFFLKANGPEATTGP